VSAVEISLILMVVAFAMICPVLTALNRNNPAVTGSGNFSGTYGLARESQARIWDLIMEIKPSAK
jgi:hypothetical protein